MLKVKHKYKSIATSKTPLKYDLMPIIPITVSFNKRSINLEALIDSGASTCFCPNEIAEYLRIQLNQCPKSRLYGLGAHVETRIHRVHVAVEHGKYEFPTDVHFANLKLHGFGFILGQQDFFKNIKVVFERQKEHLELYLPS